MERWVWVFVVACAAFFCPARVLAQAQMSSAFHRQPAAADSDHAAQFRRAEWARQQRDD